MYSSITRSRGTTLTIHTMSVSNNLLRVSRRAALAVPRSSNGIVATTRSLNINSAEKGTGNPIKTEVTGDQKLRQPGDDLLGELRKAPRSRMSIQPSTIAGANDLQLVWANCPRRL